MNALGLGTEVAKEGHKKVAATPEVALHRVTIEGVNIRVWDSPGLDDGTGNDETYLADIGSKITEELDLVILCLKMDDTSCGSLIPFTVDLIRRSWVRFPPRSKDFFFTSCGYLIPFTRANAQWVIHGFN